MNQDRSELPVNCTDGLFMTDRGLNIATSLPNQETCHSRNANSDPSDDEECPSIYLNSDTPVAQFTGEWEWYGGSVKVMTTWKYAILFASPFFTVLPKLKISSQTYDANRASHTENTSFNAANRAHGVVGFTSSLENHERNLYVVMHAKLAQFHGKLGGNIFYLTGHRYYDIIKSLDPCVITLEMFFDSPNQGAFAHMRRLPVSGSARRRARTASTTTMTATRSSAT